MGRINRLASTNSQVETDPEIRRNMIQAQMISMGFQNNQIYALLYLNHNWAEISSPDIALEVISDPWQHTYVPTDREDPTCQICQHGKQYHRPEEEK